MFTWTSSATLNMIYITLLRTISITDPFLFTWISSATLNMFYIALSITISITDPFLLTWISSATLNMFYIALLIIISITDPFLCTWISSITLNMFYITLLITISIPVPFLFTWTSSATYGLLHVSLWLSISITVPFRQTGCLYHHPTLTGRGGRIDRAKVSHAGDWEFGSQPMTYKIELFSFLSWQSALFGYGKDWLAQCQDNTTEWDIRSWYRNVLGWQHYKVSMSS